MGFSNQATGSDIGALQVQKHAALLNSVMAIISRDDGLSDLLRQLNHKGLEQQVTSWIASGKNTPVSAHQIEDALGEETIYDMAQQSGMTLEQTADKLAQLLPSIVHELTLNEQVPHGYFLRHRIDLLKEKMTTSEQWQRR